MQEKLGDEETEPRWMLREVVRHGPMGMHALHCWMSSVLKHTCHHDRPVPRSRACVSLIHSETCGWSPLVCGIQSFAGSTSFIPDWLLFLKIGWAHNVDQVAVEIIRHCYITAPDHYRKLFTPSAAWYCTVMLSSYITSHPHLGSGLCIHHLNSAPK